MLDDAVRAALAAKTAFANIPIESAGHPLPEARPGQASVRIDSVARDPVRAAGRRNAFTWNCQVVISVTAPGQDREQQRTLMVAARSLTVEEIQSHITVANQRVRSIDLVPLPTIDVVRRVLGDGTGLVIFQCETTLDPETT